MVDPVLRPRHGRLRSTFLTAAGVAILGGVFVFAVSRQGDLADQAPPAVTASVGQPVAPDEDTATGPAQSERGAAAPPDAGTSAEIVRRAGPETGLRRLPPRELPKLDQAEDAAADTPRLTLLPRPVAVDTATFLVGEARVELEGVQPIAPSRICAKGARSWPCGMQARTALRGFLRARSIRCTVPKDFGQEPATAESDCSVGNTDIGDWLVANGWARAKADGPYAEAEQRARAAGLGIWGDGAAKVDTTTTDAESADADPSEFGLP